MGRLLAAADHVRPTLLAEVGVAWRAAGADGGVCACIPYGAKKDSATTANKEEADLANERLYVGFICLG